MRRRRISRASVRVWCTPKTSAPECRRARREGLLLSSTSQVKQQSAAKADAMAKSGRPIVSTVLAQFAEAEPWLRRAAMPMLARAVQRELDAGVAEQRDAQRFVNQASLAGAIALRAMVASVAL